MKRRRFIQTSVSGLALGLSTGAKAFEKVGGAASNGRIKLIYDGDIGPDPCDFATISMLHEYHQRGHIELLGVIGATPDPHLASTFSIYNQLHGAEVPIAAYKKARGEVRYSSKVKLRYRVAMKGICYKDQNKTIYDKYGNKETLTAADVSDTVDLYRRLLSAAEENSITVYAAGQLFNFPALIYSKGDEYSQLTGEELLAQKVKEFVLMGGYFPRSADNPGYEFTNRAEWNWWAFGEKDVTRHSLQALVKTGKPITYVGAEIGPQVLTGREVVRRLGRNHPTSEAYHLYLPVSKGPDRGLKNDNPAYDEVALFVCVEGRIGKYFGEVRGSVRVNSKGANTWAPGEGYERYIALNPGVEEELAQVITDRVTGNF